MQILLQIGQPHLDSMSSSLPSLKKGASKEKLDDMEMEDVDEDEEDEETKARRNAAIWKWLHESPDPPQFGKTDANYHMR